MNEPMAFVENVIVQEESIYYFTLIQGKIPCICLYIEEGYKAFVIEMHYKCRYHFYCHQGKEKQLWY